MSFENDFPELKDKIEDPGDYHAGYEECVILKHIEKHCKSKQRIKEAIMRLPNDNRRYILLKELRLEQ